MSDRQKSIEEYQEKTDLAMEAFAKGLAKLSEETGIIVEATGGLTYKDPNTISEMSYTKDFSSGDLSVEYLIQ